MFLKSLKFELDQIWIQTSFDHNLSFVAPLELILFANRSSWPKLSDKANSYNFGTVRNCFMLQDLFAWFWCFPNCLLRSFWSSEWLLMCGYYCLLTIDWPECDEQSYQEFWVRIIFINIAGKFTLWSYLFLQPSFIALDQSSHIAWLGSN